MRIIAIEFDGTIARQGAWPYCGPVIPFARECLQKLRDSGFYIIIHSTRNNPTIPGNENKDFLEEMTDYLIKHKIPFDAIDDGTNGKPMADTYISHRCLKFEGDWQETLYMLMYGRKPKGKNKRPKRGHVQDDWLDDAGEI